MHFLKASATLHPRREQEPVQQAWKEVQGTGSRSWDSIVKFLKLKARRPISMCVSSPRNMHICKCKTFENCNLRQLSGQKGQMPVPATPITEQVNYRHVIALENNAFSHPHMSPNMRCNYHRDQLFNCDIYILSALRSAACKPHLSIYSHKTKCASSIRSNRNIGGLFPFWKLEQTTSIPIV